MRYNKSILAWQLVRFIPWIVKFTNVVELGERQCVRMQKLVQGNMYINLIYTYS